jgi:hypothetical protein
MHFTPKLLLMPILRLTHIIMANCAYRTVPTTITYIIDVRLVVIVKRSRYYFYAATIIVITKS